jgi:hypothetical protein
MNSDRIKTSREFSHYRQILCGGISGIASVAIVQMIGLQTLSLSLHIALIAFSITIPLLVFCFVAETLRNRYQYTIRKDPWYLEYSYFVGAICGIIGFASLIWNLSWIAGIIFVLFAFAVIICLGDFSNLQDKINSIERK